MRSFKADLHIHSCLSPCGELEMSPRAIVEKSLEMGLDLISVCDHNSAENVGSVMRAGIQKGLAVLAGMEISSREEVHSLAFFDTEEQALQLQEIIYRHLKGTNRPELFGDQVVANEYDEVEGFNDRLLIGAVQLGLDEIVNTVHLLGGLSIASHVDRPSFSIMSQLGFLPDGIDLDAVELSRHTSREKARTSIPGIERFCQVSFSDAHVPEDIASACTYFMIEAPSIGELRLALRNQDGRRVLDNNRIRKSILRNCDELSERDRITHT
ncbi:MAG: PHP domain-containing protein [Desulfobacteraceae bacterium]|nr:MAG: PHP domain-containing protein [Desulfobacteraceae bacterium]